LFNRRDFVRGPAETSAPDYELSGAVTGRVIRRVIRRVISRVIGILCRGRGLAETSLCTGGLQVFNLVYTQHAAGTGLRFCLGRGLGLIPFPIRSPGRNTRTGPITGVFSISDLTAIAGATAISTFSAAAGLAAAFATAAISTFSAAAFGKGRRSHRRQQQTNTHQCKQSFLFHFFLLMGMK
jgi:hypothetical protein